MRRAFCSAFSMATLAFTVIGCDDSGTGTPPAADAAVGSDTSVEADSAVEADIAGPSVERGQVVFTNNCSGCHGSDARSGSAREDLPGKSEATIRDAVRNGKSGMPSFGASQIDDDALADLVAYIKSL